MKKLSDKLTSSIIVPILKKSPQEKNEQFWIENPKILLQKETFQNFLPQQNRERVKILNIITILIIFGAIIYVCFAKDYRYLTIFAVALIVVIFLYYFSLRKGKTKTKSLETAEPYSDMQESVSVYKKPDIVEKIAVGKDSLERNKTNPMKNFTPDEMEKCQKNEEDCYLSKSLSDPIDKLLDDLEVSDEKNKFLANQFHTNPSNDVVNDQTGFAKWLYQKDKTCKEDSSKCEIYEDLRYQKSA